MSIAVIVWTCLTVGVTLAYVWWACFSRAFAVAFDIACSDFRIKDLGCTILASVRSECRIYIRLVKALWGAALFLLIVGAGLAIMEVRHGKNVSALLIGTVALLVICTFVASQMIIALGTWPRIRLATQRLLPLCDALLREWPANERTLRTHETLLDVLSVPNDSNTLLLHFPNAVTAPCQPIAIRQRVGSEYILSFMYSGDHWLVHSRVSPVSVQLSYNGTSYYASSARSLGGGWWYVTYSKDLSAAMGVTQPNGVIPSGT